jgi:hypothetical protein
MCINHCSRSWGIPYKEELADHLDLSFKISVLKYQLEMEVAGLLQF